MVFNDVTVFSDVTVFHNDNDCVVRKETPETVDLKVQSSQLNYSVRPAF